MSRRKLAMVFLPATLVLALAAALAWLQYTETGARWIWSHVSGLVPGELRTGDIRGDLRSGLTLHGLTFENEITSVVTGTVQLQLDFGLFPPAVTVESLLVDRVAITELTGSGPPPQGSIEDRLAALALPLPLDFASIRIGHLDYQRADGTIIFAGAALSFSGRWHEGLLVREARLGTAAAEWKVQGEIAFAPPFPVSAVVDSRFDLPAGGGSPPSDLSAQTTLGGNLSDLGVQAQFDHPAVSARGHIVRMLQEPGWEVEFTADELQWPLDSDAPQMTLQQVSAHGSGGLRDYQLEADGVLGISGLPAMSAEVRGTGDSRGIHIDRLHLLGDPGELTAGGQVSWIEDLRIELNSVIERLNPGQWLEGWPADHPLHGSLEGNWQNDRVEVQSISLTAGASEFSVRGNGLWDLAADRATADLEWQSLRWPVGAGQADFSSERGSVQVQGKPADWSVAGSLQLQAGQWPDGLVTVNGKGDLESVQLLVERGEVLGGNFDGQFSYRWAGRQSWSARARAKNLDISSLNKSLPGTVSGEFAATGQTGPMEIAIDIERMQGMVRGQPVTASGGVSLTAEELRARDLLIQSGQSRLELDGSLQSTDGVRFSGRIDALGKFIEGARGNLDAKGRFSANPARPRLEMDLQGSDLAWGAWRIGKITTRQADDLDDVTATRIELADLTFDNKLIEAINLTISGQNPLDRIQVEARMGATRLEASLAGALNNWNVLPDTRWIGEIRAMRIHNATLGLLDLEQASALVVDSSTLDLGPACFKGSRNGRICFDQRWRAGQGVNAHASLEAVSLNLVQLFLETDLDFSQTLTGELQWQHALGKKPYAEVRVELSPGQIAFAGDESILSSGPGLLEFRIIDGQLLAGNLVIDLPGAGSINSAFGAPDISLGVDSAIDGRIQIELDRIEPLLNWIPQLDSIAGTINADMRVSGTLADPRLTGHALLVRGKVEHSAIGLSLSDITLAGAVYNFNYTEFNGSFTSGEGRGRLKASVKFDNIFKPEISLEITGQNLNLINVPDMTVKVDPDLRLHWYDSLLNLDGRVLIPFARIAPRYLPSTSASESQDLVITSGELPPGKETFFDRSRLRLNGSVVMELGKNVTVTLEPATARLRGKATFNWDNNLLPVADGSYKLSGEVYAYGQLLEVAEGRVSFPHVPADDPHLNVNAEREIYGNVQVKQAGVHITGTLKRPVLEPYTKPVTTRERALTLLVTGHDFDYEQGVGGVEVGMYIAPRLYVSYGLGLFETQSVISARYDLKSGFGIKATSGQRETGADISYTIER